MKLPRMRAVCYTRYRSPAKVLQLGERPQPEPVPRQVLAKVMESAVTPSEKRSRGASRGMTDMAYPMIVPHPDGTGKINAIGAGVDESWLGKGEVGQKQP